MKKTHFKIGDVFAIPLKNGKWGVGQVVGQEREALNSFVGCFFAISIESLDIGDVGQLNHESLISIQFVTRDLLDSGKWPIIGNKPLQNLGHEEVINEARNNRYIGTKIRGSGVIAKFINAYWGLHPWDAWHNPKYLDQLLVSSQKKPSTHRLLFTGGEQRRG